MFCCGDKTVGTQEEIRVGALNTNQETQKKEEEPEKPQTLLEQVTEAATAVVETAKEAIADAVEAVQDKAEDVKESVQEAAEAAGIIEHKMKVEFVGPKKEVKTVEFPIKKVGFTMVAASPGCCGGKSAPGVVVKFVEKGSPAAAVGCCAGWKVKSIDGNEVESFSQADKLVKESIEKLPEKLDS